MTSSAHYLHDSIVYVKKFVLIFWKKIPIFHTVIFLMILLPIERDLPDPDAFSHFLTLYCYHLVNVITFYLTESYYIERLPNCSYNNLQ